MHSSPTRREWSGRVSPEGDGVDWNGGSQHRTGGRETAAAAQAVAGEGTRRNRAEKIVQPSWRMVAPSRCKCGGG